MTDHPISNEMLAAKAASGHSVFGPSSAHRWMVCAGSLIAGMLAGDRPTKYAAEGTVAHWVAEQWLNGASPHAFIGEVKTVDGFDIEITEEMISHIENYIDWVTGEDGDHYTEVKVDFSEYTPLPKQGGTADRVHARWQHLTITDLKYGMVRVHAKRNKQGLAYALGVFLRLDWLYNFQTITIRICQPRLDNYDEWTCTREELLEFAEELRAAAHAAWVPDAPRKPDPHACEYCPARTTCPARWNATVAMAQGSFDEDEEYPVEKLDEIISGPDLPLVPPKMAVIREMPLEQLERLLYWRKSMERLFNDIDDYILAKQKAGAPLKWWKAVIGRAGHRKWKSPTYRRRAAKMLLAAGVEPFDLYTTSIASPYQAGKLLRIARGGTVADNQAIVDGYTDQPPGRLTLAPIVDTREAIPSAASAFFDEEAA